MLRVSEAIFAVPWVLVPAWASRRSPTEASYTLFSLGTLSVPFAHPVSRAVELTLADSGSAACALAAFEGALDLWYVQ